MSFRERSSRLAAGKLSGALLRRQGGDDRRRAAAARMRRIGALDAGGADAGEIIRAWFAGKARSIAGGSNEVQLNVIAKRVLGLPG